MKYIRLFEDFEPHDPYELMMVPPNKKAEMIMREIEKDEPNLNLVSDLIVHTMQFVCDIFLIKMVRFCRCEHIFGPITGPFVSPPLFLVF